MRRVPLGSVNIAGGGIPQSAEVMGAFKTKFLKYWKEHEAETNGTKYICKMYVENNRDHRGFLRTMGMKPEEVEDLATKANGRIHWKFEYSNHWSKQDWYDYSKLIQKKWRVVIEYDSTTETESFELRGMGTRVNNLIKHWDDNKLVAMIDGIGEVVEQKMIREEDDPVWGDEIKHYIWEITIDATITEDYIKTFLDDHLIKESKDEWKLPHPAKGGRYERYRDTLLRYLWGETVDPLYNMFEKDEYGVLRLDTEKAKKATMPEIRRGLRDYLTLGEDRKHSSFFQGLLASVAGLIDKIIGTVADIIYRFTPVGFTIKAIGWMGDKLGFWNQSDFRKYGKSAIRVAAQVAVAVLTAGESLWIQSAAAVTAAVSGYVAEMNRFQSERLSRLQKDEEDSEEYDEYSKEQKEEVKRIKFLPLSQIRREKNGMFRL